MTKQITQLEVRSCLKGYLQRRPDLGLGKALFSILLEPPSPFEPEAPRRPRKAFVLALLCLLTLLAVFVHFNFWS